MDTARDYRLLCGDRCERSKEDECRAFTVTSSLDAGDRSASRGELLRHASGFILPSLSEGLPIAILEAWSYGLPVLMTRDCNLPEGFIAGAAMEIATNADRMAEALAVFLDLPEDERLAIGDHGRRLVEAHFVWDDVARRMAEVYRWLIDGGERPASVHIA